MCLQWSPHYPLLSCFDQITGPVNQGPLLMELLVSAQGTVVTGENPDHDLSKNPNISSHNDQSAVSLSF